MSTTTIDIPPNILHIVLNIQGNDIGRLRRELLASEDRNKDLSDQIERVKAEYDEIRVKLAEAQAILEQRRAAEDGQDSALDSAPLLSGIITICSNEMPKKYLKAAKAMVLCHQRSSSPLSVVTLGDEFIWEDYPETVYCLKPTRSRGKKGKWNNHTYKKILIENNEFVAYVAGTWCYMGTYTSVASSDVSPNEYTGLPFEGREALIKLSGNKTYLGDLRAMYARGELTALKFQFKRIGFNVEFRKYLLEAAGNQARDAAEEVGNCPEAEAHAEEDSSDSDASE
ncbi:hypothetical protein A0H81_13384 [Grifola frondosa]|uniref:Uncharacterized protein n=1 Tax=Grifola frondosa TaxID=5627 RepID=A0A1C7LPX0_GRIFR|nr:hypothetical protein A0H81_13384 [Grifola frondosa]